MIEDLITEAKRGDYDSFGRALTLIKDQAYRVAYSYLNDEANSMDAVCDAVEKALINLGTLKDPKLFTTWFIRIVINQCKLQLRNRQKVVPLSNQLDIPNEPIHLKDEIIDVQGLLANLPPLERLLIQLKFYFGYSLDEIAEMTDLPTGTVKTKIYGTLKKLKQNLEYKEAKV